MNRAAAGLVVAALLSGGTARASALEVPVDVGVGPAAYFLSGPVYRDQPLHAGLKIDVQAVLDRALIRANERRVPARYRKAAEQMDEVRISPSIFIPDALILSPKLRHTGLYGLTWRPLSVGVPFGSGPAHLKLSAGLLATAFFLHSDTLPNTLFARPGADVSAVLELMASRSFGLGIGWQSAFYVPQQLGHFTGLGPFSQVVWHIGQAFVQLHFRFPYEVKL